MPMTGNIVLGEEPLRFESLEIGGNEPGASQRVNHSEFPLELGFARQMKSITCKYEENDDTPRPTTLEEG